MTTAYQTPADRAKIEPGSLYSVKHASAAVAMHPVTIRRKLRAGVIQGRRRGGGHWRILGAELLKLA